MAPTIVQIHTELQERTISLLRAERTGEGTHENGGETRNLGDDEINKEVEKGKQ